MTLTNEQIDAAIDGLQALKEAQRKPREYWIVVDKDEDFSGGPYKSLADAKIRVSSASAVYAPYRVFRCVEVIE